MGDTVMTTEAPRVDVTFAKFSQATTVLLSGLAFILGQPVLVIIVAIFLALSAISPTLSPFRLLYKWVALPLHLLKPRIVEDDPAPHRFAQGIGAVFTIASSLLLVFTGTYVAG